MKITKDTRVSAILEEYGDIADVKDNLLSWMWYRKLLKESK
jgi:hypothetical protein